MTSKASRGWTAVSDQHFEIRHDDPIAFRVLIEFYGRARRKPGVEKASRGTVRLDAGQCVCGYDELANKLVLTFSQVREATGRLERRHGFIAREATSLGTIVTVLFAQEFQNRKGNRKRDRKHAASKQQLTDTENRNTGVVSSRLASPSKKKRRIERRIALLYELQEQLRRDTLGKRYIPIRLSLVRDEIAKRLAEYSLKQCKRVLQADADEVTNTNNGRFFGKGTWSRQNFTIKLARTADLEAQRADREPPRTPWKTQRARHQRHLDGLVRLSGKPERANLVEHYEEFPKRFHKKKGTWTLVAHLWDRDGRDWRPRKADDVESYED